MELVVDNILAGYFYSQFNLTLIDAGRIASYSGLMNVVSRASGGYISDLVARRWGMRGRLWWLWFVQTAAGGVCLAFGYQTKDLGAATCTMVIFSFLCHQACGAHFGVVPFVTKRSIGTVSGFVGAGGNTVAAILQFVLFTNTQKTVPESLVNLGICIMTFSTLFFTIYFPMWGSMFTPALGAQTPDNTGVTLEEAFYTREYTEEEKAQGADEPAKLFARNAMASERSKHGSSSALDLLEMVENPISLKEGSKHGSTAALGKLGEAQIA